MAVPESALRAGKPPKKSMPLHDPPWKRVLLRYLSRYEKKTKPGSSPILLWQVYRRMGWTDGQAYWKTRFGRGHHPKSRQPRELRPSELGTMAKIIKAPLGEFLAAVARATGIPDPVEYVPTPITARDRIDRAIAVVRPIVNDRKCKRQHFNKLITRKRHARTQD